MSQINTLVEKQRLSRWITNEFKSYKTKIKAQISINPNICCLQEISFKYKAQKNPVTFE
jgi:hypothetical protein